jgi:hypothetical protein
MREYAYAESLFATLANFDDVSRELSSSVHYLISRSRQGNNLPSRSPYVAAGLSTVVPGLGMGYNNRWGDAFFSFMSVGVTAAPAVYFWEEDKTFAITTALLGAFFYVGNIYGSYNGAKNFNEEIHRDFYHNTLESVPFEPSEINTKATN